MDRLPKDAPEELRSLVGRSHIYDSSCSPEAKVYFIDRDKTARLLQDHVTIYTEKERLLPDFEPPADRMKSNEYFKQRNHRERNHLSPLQDPFYC